MAKILKIHTPLLLMITLITLLLSLPRFAHQTVDSQQYIKVTRFFSGELEKKDLQAPFAQRVLVPFLASLGPFSQVRINYAAVNIFFTVMAYLLFYFYLRQFSLSENELKIGLILLLFSYPTINYSSAVLTDSCGFFFVVASSFLLLKRRYFLFSLILGLGVLARESLLFMIVAALIFLALEENGRGKIRLLLMSICISILPVLTYLITRWYFSEIPGNFRYPSFSTFFFNITRPISWFTIILVLSPFLLVFGSGIGRMKFNNMGRLPRLYRNIVFALTGSSLLLVLYAFFAVYMSGRFFWPIYLVIIPVTVLCCDQSPVYKKLLVPLSQLFFGKKR